MLKTEQVIGVLLIPALGFLVFALFFSTPTAPTEARFIGRILERDETRAILEATDGSKGIIEVNAPDIRHIAHDYVDLRPGFSATILRSPQTDRRFPVSNTWKCGGAGTACIGEIEFCCDTPAKEIGKCRDPWFCP